MTPRAAEALVAYLEAVCRPLIEEGDELRVEHGPGFGGDYAFRVRVPNDSVGYLLGRGGENAEAVRRLTRARARALGSTARVDVRVVSLTPV